MARLLAKAVSALLTGSEVTGGMSSRPSHLQTTCGQRTATARAEVGFSASLASSQIQNRIGVCSLCILGDWLFDVVSWLMHLT